MSSRTWEKLRFFIKEMTGSVLHNEAVIPWLRYCGYWLAPLLIIVMCLAVILIGVPRMQEFSQKKYAPAYSDTLAFRQSEKNAAKDATAKSVKSLQKKILTYNPKSTYLVINTTLNEFRLLRGSKLLREGICSTGSYIRLENDNNQQWFFRTPKGKFTIQGKTTNPVWRKPDWAFVEEGMKVPPENHPTRYEKGVLGDYALSLGNGYLIHGTLYKRYLGLPVTHGCVRMNDDDLESVYNNLQVGSRVYIY